ncbi:unnamed protein product [Clonostachys rhizophaga]|uniref:Uncharacterized protein n=1 Tax=Clonostachys rhizophaga TaxID=160324 RepID=A0A9N9V9Y1_9HYPO|nr:unnamed protein product [Clonostachys rhizophaga]
MVYEHSGGNKYKILDSNGVTVHWLLFRTIITADPEDPDQDAQQLKQMEIDHKSLPDADRIEPADYTKVFNPKEAHAILVQYFYKIPEVQDMEWNFLSLDEAQLVRNVDSNMTSCLERVHCEHIFSTPLPTTSERQSNLYGEYAACGHEFVDDGQKNTNKEGSTGIFFAVQMERRTNGLSQREVQAKINFGNHRRGVIISLGYRNI